MAGTNLLIGQHCDSVQSKVVLFRELGFGTFSVMARYQREGRNPRTGEKIKIPASKVVKFKAGKTFSEKIK
jgi:nucleoid DNA-binding protein